MHQESRVALLKCKIIYIKLTQYRRHVSVRGLCNRHEGDCVYSREIRWQELKVKLENTKILNISLCVNSHY